MLRWALKAAVGAPSACSGNVPFITARTVCASAGVHGETGRTGSHNIEHDPVKMQKAKEKHLRGEDTSVIHGAEGWSHSLASASEAVVKAERAPDVPLEQMQKHSVEAISQMHMADSSVLPQMHAEDNNASSGKKKSGYDVTHMPSIKENLEKGAKDPQSAGQGVM